VCGLHDRQPDGVGLVASWRRLLRQGGGDWLRGVFGLLDQSWTSPRSADVFSNVKQLAARTSMPCSYCCVTGFSGTTMCSPAEFLDWGNAVVVVASSSAPNMRLNVLENSYEDGAGLRCGTAPPRQRSTSSLTWSIRGTLSTRSDGTLGRAVWRMAAAKRPGLS